MLADAREGRFGTIVCWKSDRLSRGMFPAAVLATSKSGTKREPRDQGLF